LKQELSTAQKAIKEQGRVLLKTAQDVEEQKVHQMWAQAMDKNHKSAKKTTASRCSTSVVSKASKTATTTALPKVSTYKPVTENATSEDDSSFGITNDPLGNNEDDEINDTIIGFHESSNKAAASKVPAQSKAVPKKAAASKVPAQSKAVPKKAAPSKDPAQSKAAPLKALLKISNNKSAGQSFVATNHDDSSIDTMRDAMDKDNQGDDEIAPSTVPAQSKAPKKSTIATTTSESVKNVLATTTVTTPKPGNETTTAASTQRKKKLGMGTIYDCGNCRKSHAAIDLHLESNAAYFGDHEHEPCCHCSKPLGQFYYKQCTLCGYKICRVCVDGDLQVVGNEHRTRRGRKMA
jgi:hypothetical protein